MGVNNTSVIAISTPQSSENYYSTLLELERSEGVKLFHSISIGLCCPSCLAANLICVHSIKKMPTWKNDEQRSQMIDRILSDDMALLSREQRGIIMSSTSTFIIERAWIKKFRDREPYTFKQNVNVLYTAIDPAGGGNASDFSIVTLGFESGYYSICGIDYSSSFKHNEIMKMLRLHILGIRKVPEYQEAMILLHIEANMSFITADMICSYLTQSEFGNVVPISEDPKNKGRMGVWTGESEKQKYATILQQIMSNGWLVYADKFVTSTKTDKEVKATLEEQMGKLRRETFQPKDPAFDKFKVSYTGKSHNVRDDVCMGLQIALYQASLKKVDPQFIEFCDRMGYRY